MQFWGRYGLWSLGKRLLYSSASLLYIVTCRKVAWVHIIGSVQTTKKIWRSRTDNNNEKLLGHPRQIRPFYTPILRRFECKAKYILSWKWVHRINLNHDFLFTFWLMNFEYTHYISFICNIKKLKPFKQLSLVALFFRLFDHSKLYVYPIPKIHFISVT